MNLRGFTFFVGLLLVVFSIKALSLPPRRRQLPPRLVMKDGVEMALVPAGKYKIGSDKGPLDTRPAHEVSVPAFYMDVHEVTNARYIQFCIETGRRLPPYVKRARVPEDLKNLPVVNVSYPDAEAYAKWTRKVVPTEAEWEVAARSKKENIYPWGNVFKPVTAIRRRALAEVGSYPKDISPYGVLDMGGNVMEWTRSWYRSYPRARKRFNHFGYKRVAKGAYHRTRRSLDCRTFLRHPTQNLTRSPNIGFRCIKEIRYR